MKSLCNGTALQTEDATAQLFPQGWKVKCRNGNKPWSHPAKWRHGEPVNVKWVKNKKEAIAAMAECVSTT